MGLWINGKAVLPATIFSGDITIGANKLITTNIAMWEKNANQLAFRNIADTAHMSIETLQHYIYGGLYFKTDATGIFTNNDDDDYIKIYARKNTVGHKEIARMVSTTDPHFAVNSEEDGRHLAFNYSTIAITNFKVVKVTKAHDSDLFDASATTDNVTIWTQPVNSKLIAAMMRLETQFAGTSWSDLRVTIGLGGDPDGLVTTTGNLTSDSEDTEYEDVGAYYDTFLEGVHGKTNATIDWKAYATSTGGDLDASTAGTMDFYFLYEQP